MRRATIGLYLITAGLIGWSALGFLGDAARALQERYSLDYGEGIVWQQALLIPGPEMYGQIVQAPWIVFHYPPLYHLAVRGMALLVPDMLAAGRLVSILSTLAIGGLAGALTWQIGRGHLTRRLALLAAAVACGLVFTLPPLRFWAVLMRVDMLAIALGLAGILCTGLALRRPWWMAIAMIAFVAAVYTKQTAIAAPAAALLVMLWLRPRLALAGIGFGLVIAGLPLVALQLATEGDFLRHIVAYNVNRYSLVTAAQILVVYVPAWLPVPLLGTIGMLWAWRGRGAGDGPVSDPLARCLLATLALYGTILTLMLPGIGKSGATLNYMIEWLCAFTPGAGLLAAMAIGALRRPGRPGLLLVLLPALLLPQMVRLASSPGASPMADAASLARLEADIRRADRPVLTDEMTLPLRAGQRVTIEPAIFAELSATGAWDEAPLLAMIREGGFAFAIIEGPLDGDLAQARYSPALRAAITAALPRTTSAGNLTIHRPAGDGR